LIANDVLDSIIIDQPLSILVVDDDKIILQVVSEMLSDYNYNIILAESVSEAINILKEKDISIVLTDFVLNDGSGMDVMFHVQKYQPDAKIILMTGKPTIKNAISVIRSGAFDYLIKPFEMENLQSTVRRAANQLILERENIRLNELMSFYTITEAMGSEIKPDRQLSLILKTALKEFNADFGALHLIQENGQLALQKVICPDQNLYQHLCSFSQDFAEKVSMNSKPIIVNEAEAQAQIGLNIAKSSIFQPLMVKGNCIGALCLIRTKDIHKFTTGQLSTFSLFAGKAALSIENTKLYTELEDSYLDAVGALANAIETRDKYTAGHTDRVWKNSLGIAKILKWNQDKIKELRMGAILHDIGKIGAPDAILNKPGPLTPEEQAVMKTHPELGAHIIREIKFLQPALPYILYHHERFDGNGYPDGLKGDNIPIQGRLLAVVDTFDAIITDRPYRKGRSIDEAVEEIKRNSGTQFDPVIVEVFLEAIESTKDILINQP